jgi:hypothetical protein
MEFPPPEPITDPVLLKRRRARNWAMLIALLAIAALFYAIALVKMGAVLQGGPK